MPKSNIDEEGVITIMEGDRLVAIVYNDIQKRSKIFYKVTEMGFEEIKTLLRKDENK